MNYSEYCECICGGHSSQHSDQNDFCYHCNECDGFIPKSRVKMNTETYNLLTEIAGQLDKWALEAENWGCSTQHMANNIRRFIWQEQRKADKILTR